MTPFDNQVSNTTFNIEEYYQPSSIYLYPYARYAFMELLATLEIKSIYIPSFICRDMLAPINKLHIECFFYDVDHDLNPILKDIESDAILSVNYFGFASDIEPFLEYKEKYNAVFIEDNAHGFLSKDSQGDLLGTRGDFGLLSIRKTISLPNGAALLVNSDKYKNISFVTQVHQATLEDDKYNKKTSLKKLFINRYFGILFVLLRRLVRYIKSGSAIPLPDKESEYQLPSNKFTTPLLNNAILNIDFQKEIKRRQSIYKQVQEWAKKFDVTPIYELDENSVPFEFAFIDNGKSEEFERYLFTKGYFILPWPDLPQDIMNNSKEFYSRVKVVPFLW